MAEDFAVLAERVVDELLAASPSRAHWAGDHRFDHQLDDLSDDAVRRQVEQLRIASRELAAVDTDPLDPQDDVDLQLLAAEVDARLFELTSIDERTWNPLLHNPGQLIFGLIAREAGEPEERLAALGSRLAALPDALAIAERVLGECPRLHVETAIGQIEGTASLVRDEVPALLNRVGGRHPAIASAQEAALAALSRHRDYLTSILEGSHRDPRLGRPLWEARLWHTLDSDLTASAVLAGAQADLELVTAEITEVAAELTGSGDVAAALATLARDHPDDTTIVARIEETLAQATAFVADHDLVTLLDDPLEIMPMPEFARGVAVAYCDAPGPLETRIVPTFYAISPTPSDWPAERVESFYREYNDHMLPSLTVHEAMPGHYLQLAHARRFRGSTRVRAVCGSGSFIEGWAVYTEQLMAELEFGGLPVRIQRLKTALRMIINAIIDQGVHCDGMTEDEAMALMTGRGFQEEGEAAGKWRRAQLTSTQLSTYYVGYTEVSRIGRARPAGISPREWHDAMLSHGSPAPRHLRRLLNA
ncbi:MAG: DUF885 domain-containing protein [Actinomycetota bacterium]|nr:DUF885 domain-containing protein [Actinomycetota bacterium]